MPPEEEPNPLHHEAGFKFRKIEKPTFGGNAKNPDDVLRHVERTGYTHLVHTADGQVWFLDEREADFADYVRNNPQYCLSLASPEVRAIVQAQIHKGLRFEPILYLHFTNPLRKKKLNFNFDFQGSKFFPSLSPSPACGGGCRKRSRGGGRG